MALPGACTQPELCTPGMGGRCGPSFGFGIPAGIEEHQHGPDMVARGNGKKAIDAALKSGGVLFPDQVMQEHAHGIHAYLLGPSEFAIDLLGIEGICLPHLQFVHRVGGKKVRAHQPRLLGVPLVGVVFSPSRFLCLKPRSAIRNKKARASIVLRNRGYDRIAIVFTNSSFLVVWRRNPARAYLRSIEITVTLACGNK